MRLKLNARWLAISEYLARTLEILKDAFGDNVPDFDD